MHGRWKNIPEWCKEEVNRRFTERQQEKEGKKRNNKRGAGVRDKGGYQQIKWGTGKPELVEGRAKQIAVAWPSGLTR